MPAAAAGGGNGALMGGLLGAGAGATIGAITSQTLGGGIVGAMIGLVGGAIAGTIASGNYGSNAGYGGRGIEVTVQRDDGQQVTVAQRDDGDIQLGDRVQIVQNRQGVAQVVRDNSRSPGLILARLVRVEMRKRNSNVRQVVARLSGAAGPGGRPRRLQREQRRGSARRRQYGGRRRLPRRDRARRVDPRGSGPQPATRA